MSESNPVKSPKDHLLLSIGSEMFKAFSDPDVLLPHLIKDIPTLPVVKSQRIKINVDTAGETMAFQRAGTTTAQHICFSVVNWNLWCCCDLS